MQQTPAPGASPAPSGLLAPFRRALTQLRSWWFPRPRPPHPGMSFARSIVRRRAPWIVALLSCVALALVFMPTIDAPSIIAARKLPPDVIAAFRFYTDFGKSAWFLWPLGIALIFIAISPHEGLSRWGRGMTAAIAVRFGFLFLAIGLPSLFGTIIKRIIGRARPFVGGAADPYLYSVMAFDVRYASFPSGHATTAFAAAIAISALWPRTRAVMWTYAILMAVSRVVVTAHHPSDVVAGALVGIIGAMLMRQWFALRGLGFSMDTGGAIALRPTPSLRRIRDSFRQLLGQWFRAMPQRRLPAE